LAYGEHNPDKQFKGCHGASQANHQLLGREDDFANVHFDTDHYNHIVWRDAHDLRQNS